MSKRKRTSDGDGDVYAITRDLFRRGGPQLASFPHKTRNPAPIYIKPKPAKQTPCPALLAEQKRLIRTWNQTERRKKKQPVINRKEGKK